MNQCRYYVAYLEKISYSVYYLDNHLPDYTYCYHCYLHYLLRFRNLRLLVSVPFWVHRVSHRFPRLLYLPLVQQVFLSCLPMKQNSRFSCLLFLLLLLSFLFLPNACNILFRKVQQKVSNQVPFVFANLVLDDRLEVL